MTEIFIQLLTSLLGALGFSLLFNVERRHLFLCSLGGVITWAVYLVGRDVLLFPEIASAAVSAAACQLFSEAMARLLKAPVTAFCIPALVPLIPGGSLFRTMDAAIGKDWALFRLYGGSTLQVALGIAVGLSFITALFFVFRTLRASKRPNS